MARKAAAQIDETVKPQEQTEPITEEVEVDVSESQAAPESATIDVAVSTEPPGGPASTAQEPPETPSPPETPAEDSEKVALRQRLQEMENAVALERQQREDGQRQLQDAQRNQRQAQQQAWQDRYDSAVNTMGSAQSVIDAATQELEVAGNEGNWKQVAEAQRKLTRAETQLERAEYTKQQMDDQREQWKRRQQQPQPQRQQPVQQPQQQQPSAEQVIANSGLPDRAKTWLRQHPEYITDQGKNATIIALHDTAKRQAGTEWTDGYFEKMEELLGINAAPRPSGSGNGAHPPAEVRTAQVSAPVAREAPSMTTGRSPQPTKVTLDADQRGVAAQIRESRGRNADGSYKITQAEAERIYAKNLLEMRKRKANGELS